MPVTFTYRGKHVITILTRKDGQNLPHHIKTYCALVLARRAYKHQAAIDEIIKLGLAEDYAEADALIYEEETNESNAM